MSAWPLEDPCPDGDLPSDIEFGMWLESLDPEQVLLDLERTMSGPERARLRYLRLSLRRKQDRL